MAGSARGARNRTGGRGGEISSQHQQASYLAGHLHRIVHTQERGKNQHEAIRFDMMFSLPPASPGEPEDVTVDELPTRLLFTDVVLHQNQRERSGGSSSSSSSSERPTRADNFVSDTSTPSDGRVERREHGDGRFPTRPPNPALPHPTIPCQAVCGLRAACALTLCNSTPAVVNHAAPNAAVQHTLASAAELSVAHKRPHTISQRNTRNLSEPPPTRPPARPPPHPLKKTVE